MPFVDCHCPYCGEPIDLFVDTSAGAQAYVEDCQVCCRPINVSVGEPDDDGLHDPDAAPRVVLRAENDA